MMHARHAWLVVLLSIAARPALAQPAAPAVEIFGGFSLLPANVIDDFPRRDTSRGVQASAAFNLTRWFGIVGDVGVQWSTERDLGPGFEGLVAETVVKEYLVGPRFVARGDRAAVFVHALVGRIAGDAGEDFRGFSDTEFALGGGGGVDVAVHPRLAIRAQLDLFGSFTDIVETNSRFGVGLVVRLGGGG